MSVVVGSHVERGNVRGWIYYVSRLADDGRDERVPVWISDLGEPEDAANTAENLLAGTRRTNGGESLVLSFAAREMDINNPDDVQECGDLAYKLAKLIAPNCPAIVGVHVDSDGGLVHAHILILNHDVSTGLSNQNDMRITKCRRINDKLMVETGHEVCPIPEITGPSYYNNGQEIEPEDRVELAAATTLDTVRQYLRQEVDAAMAEPGVETVEDLAEVAAERGLNIRILPDNGYGKGVTYAAVDEDGEAIKHQATGGRSKKPRNISVAQKSKGLGDAYSYESLDKKLKEVAKEAETQAEAVAVQAETDPAIAEALSMQEAADAALRASIGAESPRDRMARLMKDKYKVVVEPETVAEAPEEPAGESEPEYEEIDIDIDTPEPRPAPMPEPELVHLDGEDGDEDADATVEPVTVPVVEEEPDVPVVPPVVEDDDDEEQPKKVEVEVEVVADPEPVTVPEVVKEPEPVEEPVKVEERTETATNGSDGGDDGQAEPKPVDVETVSEDGMFRAPYQYVAAGYGVKARKKDGVVEPVHERVMARLRRRVRDGVAGNLDTAYAEAAKTVKLGGKTAHDHMCKRMRGTWVKEYGTLGDRDGQMTYEEFQQQTAGAGFKQGREKRAHYAQLQAVVVDKDRQPGS